MRRTTVNTSALLVQYTCNLDCHQQWRVGEQTTASTMYSNTKMATPKPTCGNDMLLVDCMSEDTDVEQAPGAFFSSTLCALCIVVEHHYVYINMMTGTTC